MSNKTIHISKESMERFNHDKNVVGITQKELMEDYEGELVECPFNDQADLCSDAVFDNLFDNAEWREQHEYGCFDATHYVVGFISEKPVVCFYWYNMNSMHIKYDFCMGENEQKDFEELLTARVSDDGQTFAKLKRVQNTKNHKEWELNFYYTPEYAKENLG